LLGALALATAAVAWGRSPGPPLCGDSPEAAKRWAAQELRVAQRAFPRHGLKLGPPPACTCNREERWCTRRATELAAFKLAAPASRVEFVVAGKVLRLRPEADPQPLDRRGKPIRPKAAPERVLIAPFASPAAAVETAARLRQLPLALAAFGRDAKLYCSALADFSYDCAAVPFQPHGQRRLAPAITFREWPEATSPRAQPLRPVAYRLPGSLVPADAPYWREARGDPRVSRYAADHPDFVVEVFAGQPAAVLVRERPGSDAGLTVVLRAEPDGGLVIDRVVNGAKRVSW
jgi:hypothetical protein